MLGFVAAFQLLSCGGAGDDEDPSEKIKAFCIRECVLEHGDSTLCDGWCGCTADKLTKELSEGDIKELLGLHSDKGSKGDQISETAIKYKNAFYYCKSARF